jgi:gliding motility-associated-like protein
MKRFLTILLLLIPFFSFISATHNRAGEITYTQVSDLTYEVTVTTFTYTLTQADRQFLDISWGDNSISTVERDSKIVLPNNYYRNIYRMRHTYPGPGVYKILVQDPNRNADVLNIPGSVNVVFSISTILMVNPSMGRNSTPVLLNPPYDKAALGYVFIHNPAAYDPDGDSLSYKLTVCTREDGKPIENYSLPPATRYFRVDSLTGDLTWDSPSRVGKYNVAIEIQEWRNGEKIGFVVRDMQIEVYETNNKPPVNSPLTNMCVEAGDSIGFIVSASDENNDTVSLISNSGIYTLDKCPARFTKLTEGRGFSSSFFSWTPCYESVRHQPYSVIFKSDDDNSDVNLSDIDNMTIKVMAKSPDLLGVVPAGKFISLSWAPYGTPAITGFRIYRREGISVFPVDGCMDGIPISSGFVAVGYAPGSSTTSFIDSNNGKGLELGIEYYYRVVAVLGNGTESKPSNERVTSLITGIPVIRNVSVRNTDTVNGSVYIAWKKPGRLDTIPGAAGPYEYIVSRTEGISGTAFTRVHSSLSLDDTTCIDTLVNTRATGLFYKIVLWNRSPGNNFVIGDSSFASSVFLSLNPGDRKMRLAISRNVPWINSRYDIYRWNDVTLEFDSICSTNQLNYIDTGLQNGTEYLYYVKSAGDYMNPDLPKNLVNLSQKVSAVALDNEPPCPPMLNVMSDCDNMFNRVSWEITDPGCIQDVEGYRVFYKRTYDEEMHLIATINGRDSTSIRHEPGDIISGCYAVSSFDALGNEGEKSVVVCIDSCNFYEIPNVFTPNNDNINDRLIARTSRLVERVDFKLFNRNGMLIFKTDKPRIEWDGTYNGRIVSPGVYFYQCDVFENRVSGVEQFHISGFVHVITEAGERIRKETMEAK